MKKQIIVNKQIEEVIDNIQFPIYSYHQLDNMEEEYVRIDEKGFLFLKFTHRGINIYQIPHKYGIIRIGERYLINNCDKETFNKVLRDAKKYINSIKTIE